MIRTGNNGTSVKVYYALLLAVIAIILFLISQQYIHSLHHNQVFQYWLLIGVHVVFYSIFQCSYSILFSYNSHSEINIYIYLEEI